MAAFEARGIDHVGIRYRDLKAAVTFFRDALGLEVTYHAKTMASVDMGNGGAHLALFQAEGDEPLRQPHHVAIRVPDVDAAVTALECAGIPMQHLGPNLGFFDNEGNAFHFVPAS